MRDDSAMVAELLVLRGSPWPVGGPSLRDESSATLRLVLYPKRGR